MARHSSRVAPRCGPVAARRSLTPNALDGSMSQSEVNMTVKDNTKNPRFTPRAGVAVAIALLIATYTLFVVAGGVPIDRRIDSVHLVIIVVGVLCCVVLLDPSLIDRVRRLEQIGRASCREGVVCSVCGGG